MLELNWLELKTRRLALLNHNLNTGYSVKKLGERWTVDYYGCFLAALSSLPLAQAFAEDRARKMLSGQT